MVRIDVDYINSDSISIIRLKILAELKIFIKRRLFLEEVFSKPRIANDFVQVKSNHV